MSAFSVKPASQPPAALGCPCPLAGRSRRPSRPPLTARLWRFRPPGSACGQSSLPGTGTPPLVKCAAPDGKRQGPGPSTEATPPDTAALTATATRRHDAANQHQRNDENLGFSSVRPREKPTGCRRFP